MNGGECGKEEEIERGNKGKWRGEGGIGERNKRRRRRKNGGMKEEEIERGN